MLTLRKEVEIRHKEYNILVEKGKKAQVIQTQVRAWLYGKQKSYYRQMMVQESFKKMITALETQDMKQSFTNQHRIDLRNLKMVRMGLVMTVGARNHLFGVEAPGGGSGSEGSLGSRGRGFVERVGIGGVEYRAKWVVCHFFTHCCEVPLKVLGRCLKLDKISKWLIW